MRHFMDRYFVGKSRRRRIMVKAMVRVRPVKALVKIKVRVKLN